MQLFNSFFKKKILLPYSDFDTEPFFEDKFKEILGNKIAYKDEGSGPVIFCIPPWPTTSTAFTPFIHVMKDYFRLITLDMPGWGGLSPKMNMKPTLENYNLIVEEFIKSFGITDFHMLGYSIGGMIIQMIMKRKTLQPGKIVLVSTSHTTKQLNKVLKLSTNTYSLIKRLHLSHTLLMQAFELALRSAVNRRWYVKRYIRSPFFMKFKDEEEHMDFESVFGVLDSMKDLELFNEYYKGNPEILIIYGDQDEKFVIDGSDELGKYYGIKPVILPNCDHHHFFVDVNKSDQIIYDFLI